MLAWITLAFADPCGAAARNLAEAEVEASLAAELTEARAAWTDRWRAARARLTACVDTPQRADCAAEIGRLIHDGAPIILERDATTVRASAPGCPDAPVVLASVRHVGNASGLIEALKLEYKLSPNQGAMRASYTNPGWEEIRIREASHRFAVDANRAAPTTPELDVALRVEGPRPVDEVRRILSFDEPAWVDCAWRNRKDPAARVTFTISPEGRVDQATAWGDGDLAACVAWRMLPQSFPPAAGDAQVTWAATMLLR